jgi:hypothetical protein
VKKWTAIMDAYGDYRQLDLYKSAADAKWAIQSEIGKKMKTRKVSNEEYELDGRHIAITTDEAKYAGYENLKEGIKVNEELERMAELAGIYEAIIGTAVADIKVVIDIDKSNHAGERQSRHGEDNPITDEEIFTLTKRAIPTISKLLMLDKISIGDEICIQTNAGLNVVGAIKQSGTDLLLRVITVMKKQGFRPKPGTISIRV